MSVDTYFCYCCLSDKNLISLFNTTDVNGKEESYADMLASSFAIKITKSEFEDIDTNERDEISICEVCAVGLKSTVDLRNSVLQTLNVLEINNVITTTTCDSFLFVTKVQGENSSEDVIEQSDRINHNSEMKEEYMEEYEEVEYLDLSTEEVDLDEPDLTNAEEEAQISSNNGYNVHSKVKRKRTRSSVNKKKEALDAKKVKIRTVEKIPYEIADNLKCPLCANEKFATEKTYHIHMNTHYPNHLCPTCGRSFATKLRLIRHVQTHNGGVFPCTNCDQVCKTKESLRSHCKRKHYEVKVNKCTICSERFDSYHARMVHLAKVHGAGNKHSCKYCSKTFLESTNLYSHVKHVHMKKKYVCPFCKEGYSRKERLEAHLTSHTGQRNYMCSICSKTFKNEIAVRVHIKKKHPGVMD